jgi:hypothetical protein
VILTTTTVTIEERSVSEPYEAPSWTASSSGVPAHIGEPSGAERIIGGSQENIDAVLLAEAGTPVWYTSRILDEVTGERFEIVWVQDRQGLGLDHVKAGLRRTTGLASG